MAVSIPRYLDNLTRPDASFPTTLPWPPPSPSDPVQITNKIVLRGVLNGKTRRAVAQVKEHFHHHNVDKDKEALRNEVTKVKKQIVSGEHIALHQRSELQKLSRIIQEADEERQRQVRTHINTNAMKSAF